MENTQGNNVNNFFSDDSFDTLIELLDAFDDRFAQNADSEGVNLYPTDGNQENPDRNENSRDFDRPLLKKRSFAEFNLSSGSPDPHENSVTSIRRSNRQRKSLKRVKKTSTWTPFPEESRSRDSEGDQS